MYLYSIYYNAYDYFFNFIFITSEEQSAIFCFKGRLSLTLKLKTNFPFAKYVGTDIGTITM